MDLGTIHADDCFNLFFARHHLMLLCAEAVEHNAGLWPPAAEITAAKLLRRDLFTAIAENDAR